MDGHDYINKAFSMGASVCVCERVPDDVKKPCIVVPDTMTALADIAAYYLGTLSCKVVGITGSVGKTTTKEFIAAILSAKYNVIKTQKNFNNEVGLPLTVLSIRPEHEVAVLEMGIADFGQMRFLANIARPDVEVITNIGTWRDLETETEYSRQRLRCLIIFRWTALYVFSMMMINYARLRK